VKNAAYRLTHDVVLAVHNVRNPNREEWDAYLEMMSSVKEAFGGDCARFRQLIFTDGGAPNAAQRKAVVDIARGLTNVDQIRVVIISRSVVARGIVTAFRWLGFPLRSFAPDELDEAFAFLAVSKAEAVDLCDAAMELCATVDGPVRSASRIEAYRIKLSA
jgi:hypothetical protein